MVGKNTGDKPVLSVSGLTIAFGSTTVVHDLTFEIAAGETLAVVGESGSGKSVTSLAIMGLLPERIGRASGSVKLGDRVGQTLERFRIIERALYETDTGRKLLPSRFLERRTAMRLHVLLDEVLEMVLGPVAACEACQTEAWRQQATVGQIVDGGEQLLTGQIAGHAENHDAAWACDAGKSQIARVAQRIRPCVGRVGCG